MVAGRIVRVTRTSRRGGRVVMARTRRMRPRWTRGLVSKHPPHLFKYYVNRGPLTFNTSVNTTSTGLTFALSDIGSYAELTALFDQYKINKIIIKITPVWTETLMPTIASSPVTPQILSAIDYDDSSAPAEADIRQYSSCKESNGFKCHKRTLYPKMLSMAYKSLTTTAYAPTPARYLDCADNSTPHYGLKIWMNNGSPSTSGSPWSARIECVYYVSCKNQC